MIYTTLFGLWLAVTLCAPFKTYLAEFHRTVNILVDVEEKNHCSALILFYYLEKTGNPLSKKSLVHRNGHGSLCSSTNMRSFFNSKSLNKRSMCECCHITYCSLEMK